LTRKGFIPNFFEIPEISKKVKDFIRRVVPEKYHKGDLVSERGRLLVDDEYLTPRLYTKK